MQGWVVVPVVVMQGGGGDVPGPRKKIIVSYTASLLIRAFFSLFSWMRDSLSAHVLGRVLWCGVAWHGLRRSEARQLGLGWGCDVVRQGHCDGPAVFWGAAWTDNNSAGWSAQGLRRGKIGLNQGGV